MDEVQRRISANIRAVAKRRKIALAHLPDRAAVGRGHFWKVMAGTASPTVAWLARLAVALDVDVVELVRPR